MAAILAAPPADVYGTLARSAQLAELVGGGLVGWQQHGEVLLLVAGSGERDDVEAERSRGRVLVKLGQARAKLADELAGFLGSVDDQGAGRIGGECR
jgi:hypothetical protein